MSGMLIHYPELALYFYQNKQLVTLADNAKLGAIPLPPEDRLRRSPAWNRYRRRQWHR
jgi:hypothetical protein